MVCSPSFNITYYKIKTARYCVQIENITLFKRYIFEWWQSTKKIMPIFATGEINESTSTQRKKYVSIMQPIF